MNAETGPSTKEELPRSILDDINLGNQIAKLRKMRDLISEIQSHIQKHNVN